jgi:hypothetical protein
MNWYKKASINNQLVESISKDKDIDSTIIEQLADDIEKEINNLGVSYVFEPLSGALGIARNSSCSISTNVLKFPVADLMFVLFHELAHYYQYRKYGTDFVLYIYTNSEEQLDVDARKLKSIENTADKFSVMKTNYYLNKYKINQKITMNGYSNFTIETIKSQLVYFKKIVAQKKFKTVDEINNFIYNMIK